MARTVEAAATEAGPVAVFMAETVTTAAVVAVVAAAAAAVEVAVPCHR